MSADVLQLLDHARRRSIACAALDAPVTIGEIANHLGTADGAIRTVVERMARQGLLEPSERSSARRPGSSAVAYQVASEYVERVRELCRSDDGPSLKRDGEVLLVPLAGLSAAAGVLAHVRPSVVGWAVRTRDPQLSLMIGLRPDSAPEDRDALLLRLRDQGVECGRLYIGEAFSPTALFEYASGVAADRGRALPPGD